MSMFTLEQKLRCVARELNMRRRVYPRWVEQKRMSQDKANLEIALMEQIISDYQTAIKKNANQPTLF